MLRTTPFDVISVDRDLRVRLSPTAVLPVRATDGAVGYDLSAAHAVTVPAHGKQIVPTDLTVAFPDGIYGRVAPRYI